MFYFYFLSTIGHLDPSLQPPLFSIYLCKQLHPLQCLFLILYIHIFFYSSIHLCLERLQSIFCSRVIHPATTSFIQPHHSLLEILFEKVKVVSRSHIECQKWLIQWDWSKDNKGWVGIVCPKRVFEVEMFQ